MTNGQITLDELRNMARQAGLKLSDDELQRLLTLRLTGDVTFCILELVSYISRVSTSFVDSVLDWHRSCASCTKVRPREGRLTTDHY